MYPDTSTLFKTCPAWLAPVFSFFSFPLLTQSTSSPIFFVVGVLSSLSSLFLSFCFLLFCFLSFSSFFFPFFYFLFYFLFLGCVCLQTTARNMFGREETFLFVYSTDFCEGGELFDYLWHRNPATRRNVFVPFEERFARRIFRQFMSGVAFMHENNCFHRFSLLFH